MLGRKRLNWVASSMGELEAREGNYRFVVFHDPKRKTTELRFIRYDSPAQGLGIPFYDFSIFTRDVASAKRLSERLNREFRRARRYNGFTTL